MKKTNTLIVLAILLFALTSPAYAAPREFTFTIPVSIDFTGATVDGKPVTQWQIACEVRSLPGDILAQGKSFVFAAMKMNLTTKVVAQPTADWLAGPDATPARWFCAITDGGNFQLVPYTLPAPPAWPQNRQKILKGVVANGQPGSTIDWAQGEF
jgi:hypothetical protein